MKNLKIINDDNQKGYHLETYGNGFEVILNTPTKIGLTVLCLITQGTNWLIPKIWTIQNFWIRW